MTQVCEACTAANPPGAKFCVECGNRLVRACPACGAAAEGYRFCMECGTPLDGAAGPQPTRPSTEPVSERRTTTVLFGDLVGFTTLAESRDPEEVRELLSAYFAVARTVVGRYGGTIEKFIGDAVMAVWGVPVAHEDDAERAVRAGLDLIAEVAALGESVGAPGLSMRVGLVTGSVAVTLGAANEGMVAGDAVNTAARVQASATPGTVWVDQETRGLTAAAITFSDMGEHELKGKAEPLRLFRADAIVAAVGGAQRVDGLEAPMVGRDREIREVKELFHATQTDGRARLAVVHGVAGVGKSRLGWEFEKYADGLSDLVYWHRGRCLSYGEGVAYRAFAEMVRARIGLREGQSGPVVEELTRDFLGTVAKSADEAAWLRPRILALLTAAGGGFERTDLFAAWTTFLERVAVDGAPLVLLFEDMQHADTGVLDLVEHLLQACRVSLFVVVLTRPELLERRPTLAAGRRTVPMDLAPLPELAMGALVDGLVDDLPPSARSALVKRAEGIPLYAVETVRSLIDRDAVVSRAGRYVFVDHDHQLVDLDQLSAPSSLQTLVSARLDALAPAERRAVQDASVLGMSFTEAGLVALSELSDFEVDAALEGLVRKGIVATQDDPRSPERGQYYFLQSIVREVAHGTLARRDLRTRHLAAADHLEATGGDDVGAVVAQHLLDALAAGGADDPDRPELLVRARRLLTAAADRAQALGSPEEALRLTMSALDLGPGAEERAELLHRAAQAALDNAQHQRAHTLALEAAGGFSDLGNTVSSLRSKLVATYALYLLGRIQDGLVVMREVESAVEHLEVDDQLMLTLLHMRCYAARSVVDSEWQLRSAVEHVVFAERTTDRRGLALALNQLAVALLDAGSRTTHRALLERVIEISREEGDLISLGRGLTNTASETYTDDLEPALRLSVEAYEVSVQSGSMAMAEVALINLVYARYLHGEWDEVRSAVTAWFDTRESTPSGGALRLADAMVRAARAEDIPQAELVESEERWELNVNKLYAAHLQAQAGDRVGAAAAARESVIETYPLGEHQWEDFELSWTAAVMLALQAGDLAGIEQLVEHAETGWHTTPLLRAEVARVRGTLARARGQDPEVDLRSAIEQHERYGAPYLLGLARRELGEWLLEQGRVDEGAGLLDQARRAFGDLGVVERVWA